MSQISYGRTIRLYWVGGVEIGLRKIITEANWLGFKTYNAFHSYQYTNHGTLHYWDLGICSLSGYLLLNFSLHTQYWIIFPQKSIWCPLYLKISSEWHNFGVSGNMGSLDCNPGLPLLQIAYFNVCVINILICLSSRNSLSKSGGVFISIFLVRQRHWLIVSLWLYIWQHNHYLIVVALCETIFTNNTSHTRHHITPIVNIWNCTRVIPLMSLSLSERSSQISPLVPYLIVRWRVLTLVFSLYGIFFRFIFTVIRVRASCRFLNVPQNIWFFWGFTNWGLMCDLDQSSVRYHFLRGPLSIHWLQPDLVFSVLILSLC